MKKKTRVTKAIVLFLLLQGTAYTDDLKITSDFINEDIIEYINTPGNESNVFVGSEKNDINFTNNAAIKISYEEKNIKSDSITSKGNGINIVELSNKVNIANNGLITGEAILTGGKTSASITGNGISSYNSNNSIGTITNDGLITGNVILTGGTDKADASTAGNGISSYGENNGSTIVSIINNGLVTGKADLVGGTADRNTYAFTFNAGNGISSYGDNTTSSIGAIENNGLLTGKADLVGGTSEIIILGESDAKVYSRVTGNGITSYSYGDSRIEYIMNKGIISGEVKLVGGTITSKNDAYAEGYSRAAGNGISSYSYNRTTPPPPPTPPAPPATNYNSSIGAIENNGLISGKAVVTGGNVKKDSTAGLFANSYASAIASGNGIISYSYYNNSSSIGDTINNGLISGYINATSGTKYGVKDYENIEFSGNGIAVNGNVSSTITNNGVIKGSQSAIAAGNITGIVNNYGVMAGRKIYSDGQEIYHSRFNNKNLGEITPVTENNYGVYIKLKEKPDVVLKINSLNINNQKTGKVLLDNDNDVVIESITNGSGGDSSGKTIINATKYGDAAQNNLDSYETISTNKTYANNIINGAGIKKGVLDITSGIVATLTDSVVNAYKTAVTLGDNSELRATNTIFNGGGLENKDIVIKGNDGDNIVTLLGDSIINGSIDLGDGNNKLTIGNEVQVNGSLNGGSDNDILNLGATSNVRLLTAKAASNLNIIHDITGFENINTNGNTTLFETVKVTGAKNITLESGSLLLRVDPSIKSADGKITGHALYGNNGILRSTGGDLVVGVNGLGEGTTISMGGTTITPETNDDWWKNTDHIRTNSLVLDGKLSADGKDINITVFEDIPDTSMPLNSQLNKVYRSIVTAGEIGKLSNTTLLEGKTRNVSLDRLLVVLDQIYANNPYAYTLKSSRDSLKLFEDNMSYLTIKPQKGEWIVQGKAIYTGVKNDSPSSVENNSGFDSGHRNYKTTTNTVGGLSTFEYGLSDKTSAGLVVGGNNQNVNFKGSSEIDGDSLYLGTFAKTEVDNFRFMGGLGYQYTSADADRSVSNKYDSFKTNEKYDINSFNAFVEAKYVYEGTQNWKIEPKTRLSYYYIDQESVNEGYKADQLSIGVDKANSKTADLEVGVDIVKTVLLEKGKLNNIFSLGVINTLGNDSKDLKGYVIGKDKNGSKFDIQGTELPRTSGKAGYNLELEQSSGMIYTAGVSLEFAEDYNRNVNATVGIGYKF
ncbi:MAG: autotransporter domain-containing protein [Fusobacteriaceae bacterium]